MKKYFILQYPNTVLLKTYPKMVVNIPGLLITILWINKWSFKKKSQIRQGEESDKSNRMWYCESFTRSKQKKGKISIHLLYWHHKITIKHQNSTVIAQHYTKMTSIAPVPISYRFHCWCWCINYTTSLERQACCLEWCCRSLWLKMWK